jgi:hypothetical protein
MIELGEVNQTVGGEVSPLPWEIRPCRLVNWWAMEKFSAESFFEMASILQKLAGASAQQEDLARHVESSRDEHTEKRRTQVLETVIAAVGTIERLCSRIGLQQPPKHAKRFMARLKEGKPNPIEIRTAIAELHARIRDEMEDHLFMHIPSDRVPFYNQAELFGKQVNAVFSGIQFDMVEAGNCYAAGRATAVVFHLMRIMEIGVQQFGTKLGVTLADEKNWQNILNEVNKAIKALPPKDSTTVAMSQASASLYAVKLAWRNEVMHPKDTYTLEEADNLIRQVKIFMEQLATII